MMANPRTEKTVLKGHGAVEGIAEGNAIVTRQAFAFSHGVHPQTGVVSDVRHELKGESIAGRVLVYPYGRGSSTGDLWMLEVTRCGKSPAAIINLETDPITVAGSVLSKLIYSTEIPIVDRLDKNPLDVIKTGDYLRVDGTRGIVEVLRRG
jgi:hypothetical protein